jgi:hypothetical protein
MLSCKLQIFYFRDDPPKKEDNGDETIHENSGDETESEEEEEEVEVAGASANLEDVECECERCPTREQFGGRVVCCMTLDRWQNKFVSEGGIFNFLSCNQNLRQPMCYYCCYVTI